VASRRSHRARPVLRTRRRLAAAPLLLLLADTWQRQPPVLTAFQLNDGAPAAKATEVLVAAHQAVGAAPSEYRISPRADFAGAPWLPYVPRPRLEGWDRHATPGCEAPPGSRRLRVYLQVRSHVGDEVRIVNGQRVLVPSMVESNVLLDSICLVPAPRPT
jgi:hypothetical protein